MRRRGRLTTTIITQIRTCPSVVLKPVYNPEKMNVIAVAAYRIYFEEEFQPLLVSLRKRVI
jgi:hypothetical protein